jgi:hypothetical protein
LLIWSGFWLDDDGLRPEPEHPRRRLAMFLSNQKIVIRKIPLMGWWQDQTENGRISSANAPR